MKKPTILLADDHKIVLDGLRGLLSSRYELIAAVTNGHELVDQVAALQPDLVVADISMPLLNGIDALAQLHLRNRNPKVVFLTMHPDATYLTRALEAGALGYVIKHAAAEQLLIALEHALAGQVYISPEMRHSSVTEQLDPTRRHQKNRHRSHPPATPGSATARRRKISQGNRCLTRNLCPHGRNPQVQNDGRPGRQNLGSTRPTCYPPRTHHPRRSVILRM